MNPVNRACCTSPTERRAAQIIAHTSTHISWNMQVILRLLPMRRRWSETERDTHRGINKVNSLFKPLESVQVQEATPGPRPPSGPIRFCRAVILALQDSITHYYHSSLLPPSSPPPCSIPKQESGQLLLWATLAQEGGSDGGRGTRGGRGEGTT